MGRSTQQETVLQHFSHIHPLQLSTLQPESQVQCNGCNSQCSGLAYRCLPCNYILHKSCAQIPRSIKHPSHLDHPLTLCATPPYANTTTFSCDACGLQGSAFSFHCTTCEFDIHPTCASFPRIIHYQSHPHELLLQYESPYGEVAYTCDICGAIGSRHWMYRCADCGFDAHLGCATSKPQHQQSNNLSSQSQPRPQVSSPALQLPVMTNPFLHSQLLANQFSNGSMGEISELFRRTIEAQTMIGNEIMRSTFEAQTRSINEEIARINAADQYERMVARPTSNPFQVRPIGQTAPPSTLPRPWADLLINSMQQMSVNNIHGGGNGQQGVSVSAMGDSSGLQGANGGFGVLGNQAGFTAPDNLTDLMNGYDWSDVISNGLGAATGFM